MQSIEHANCAACPLYRPDEFTPVLGYGPKGAALIVVGEAPSWQDRDAHLPFVGGAGNLLNQTLAKAGMPRDEVYTTNVVACRAVDAEGQDTAPPAQAAVCCRGRLLAELNALTDPKMILSVGATAAKALLGTKQGIMEIHGVVEHRASLPAPVLPTYHPSAVLHSSKDQAEDMFDDLFSATKRAIRIAKGDLEIPNRDEVIPWKHLTDRAAAEKVLIDIAEGKAGYLLAIDVETGGLDVISDPLLQVSIGNTERGVAFEAEILTTPGDCEVIFKRILRDPKFTWLIHNSSFDLQWFKKHFDVDLPNVIDTICLALGGTEIGRRVSLKRLSREWLNAAYYEEDVHSYLPNKGASWTNVPRALLAEYAVKDVVYTARMYPILENLCIDEGTRDLAYDILMPAQRLFAEIGQHGVLVDQTYLATLETVWQPKIDDAVSKLQAYVASEGWAKRTPVYGKTLKNGKFRTVAKPKDPSQYEIVRYIEEKLNPRSPLQIQEFLFDHLKLPLPNGDRTAGKDFRDVYPNHPFTRHYEEFGVADHMLNAYVRGIGKHIKADGRVHPSAKIAGTKTGRLSYSDPAIQTIPREDYLEDEKSGERKFDSIKRMFLPSRGFVWGETDFSQLELRVAWALTGDEQLGEAIMSGDFHRMMSSRMLKIPPAEITSNQRHLSKRVTFGLMYGRQALAIAGQLTAEGIPTRSDTAQGYIDDFFRAAPKYHEWFISQQRQALEVGRAVTPFGRVRRWHLITRENRGHVLNQSVNYPIQSVASDITLKAAIRVQPMLRERGLGSVLFLVHDALAYELREGREAEGIALIERVMLEWPFDAGNAVLGVDTKIGPTWGDAH
jgi:uracil-DNA glycosylase family 4